MTDTTNLGPWVRRFLLEHLIGERNLARNTQRSYRDTLALMLPFIAAKLHKQVDQLTIGDYHCRASATVPSRPGAYAWLQRGDAQSTAGGDSRTGVLHRGKESRTY